MDFELEARYFTWLHGKVVLEFAPTTSRSYYELFKILHATEFVWVISGDDNRAEYGKTLRATFLNGIRQPYAEGWDAQPCSVLEMLIALAEEAEFETDFPHAEWFWRFMLTLDLDQYNDSTHIDVDHVEHILDRLVWRKYEYNGTGGLFPLEHPQRDQRNVEIWYQFCAYVIERAMV